ncbi:MAG: hypothetical protein LBQ81_07400 [Zoogloeaceae bacterium]|jgi:hypothetical protein|nr:hypothetical protein [Zoogloeaceae bacterium]
MNLKVIVLMVCAGYGIWFALIGGKQIEEAHVHTLYNQLQSSFVRGDIKTYCGLISDEVSGKVRLLSRQQSMREETSVDKASLCASAEAFHQSLEQLKNMAMTRRQNFSYNDTADVTSITISPDRKMATVETVGDFNVQIGGKTVFSVHSTSVDQLKRNFGRTKIVHVDGTTVTQTHVPR